MTQDFKLKSYYMFENPFNRIDTLGYEVGLMLLHDIVIQVFALWSGNLLHFQIWDTTLEILNPNVDPITR